MKMRMKRNINMVFGQVLSLMFFRNVMKSYTKSVCMSGHTNAYWLCSLELKGREVSPIATYHN